MNALKNIASKLALSKPAQMKAKKIFDAVDSKNFEQAVSLASTYSEIDFKKQILRYNEVPLIMDLTLNDNIEGL